MITEKMQNFLDEKVKYWEWSHEYNEPGYSCDKPNGILFANWNDVSDKIIKALEYSFELEWSDEWSNCSNCGKCFRTSPDSYHWQGAYYLGDGEIFCLDCLDLSEILWDYVNNPRKAFTWVIYDHFGEEDKLIELGFTKYNQDSYENGFHPGQNANPEKIYKECLEHGYKSVLFVMTNQGQFDVDFDCFVSFDSPGFWDNIEE